MSEEEAISELMRMISLGVGDSEIAHSEADEILLKFLKANGYKNVARAWEEVSKKVGFWYA